MKLKFWDRVVLFIGALIMAIIGAGILVLGCQVSTISMSPEGQFFSLRRVIVLIAGAVAFLYGLYVLILPRRRSDRHGFVVQKTDNGELRISIKAIENLVVKCVEMHEEIHVVSMSVSATRDGVKIDLRISLANNISIPLAVASLQKQIKQYLLASSGIDVKDVCVMVETAANANVGDSPYLVAADMPLAAKAEEETAKKRPLHQRIFGKDAQSATLPEPPAPEEEAPQAEETTQDENPVKKDESNDEV